MTKPVRALVALLAAGALLSGPSASAEPIVTNPFGTLSMDQVVEPSGTTPGRARLTISTGSGAAFSQGSTIWFGLRLMGTEDLEMQSFRQTIGGCTISDFAGQNTSGYQGAPVFAAGDRNTVGTPNSHMRMIGGFIRKSCGNLVIDVTFRTKPVVVYYAAFFGSKASPWSNNYDEAPWSVVPTGGNRSYEQWWNIWGTFDTLGYSNACTYVTGVPACG